MLPSLQSFYLSTILPVLVSSSVSWQIVEFEGAPMDTILYTLDKGVDKIILLGGMEMEVGGRTTIGGALNDKK